MIPIEGIARIVHEANRAYNVSLDDPAPDQPWDALPGWHREQIARRVKLIIEGSDAAQIHQEWADEMMARGWKLGDVKNPCASPPTHTCLRPWSELPDWQRRKDIQAIAIVLVHTQDLEV
jgi:RyR domain